MYASTIRPDAAAPRRGGFAAVPLLALCCLLFILFAIAATIVLALIPIYLPRKEATLSSSGKPIYFTLTPQGDLGPDGVLDAASTQSIADAMSRSLGYPAGAIKLTKAEVVSGSGKRKRRRRNLWRPVRQNGNGGGRNQRLRCEGRTNPSRCGSCRISETFEIREQIILRGIIFLLIALALFFANILTFESSLIGFGGGDTGSTASTAPTSAGTTTTSAIPLTTANMPG